MLKIATPISSLLKDEENISKIMKHSDCFECRDNTFSSNISKQEIFHCELQPIHNFTPKEFQYLEKIADKKNSLKVITFHMASSNKNPHIVDGIFQPNGENYSREELLRNARNNFRKIKQIFGKKVMIGIENNNYYPTDAYEFITDADFISTVVYKNDLTFLFDVAHAKITAYNKKQNYKKYKQKLPLDRTIQLHISLCGLRNDIMFDLHNCPNDEEFKEIHDMISHFSQIRYLTIEYYQDMTKLIASIQRVKRIINELH